MPIYEYMCEKCNKITERMMSINSRLDTIECKWCNCDCAKRMISVPSRYEMKGYSAKNGYSKGEK